MPCELRVLAQLQSNFVTINNLLKVVSLGFSIWKMGKHYQHYMLQRLLSIQTNVKLKM